MKNILAFGASNSKKSINKTFAVYVAHKIEGATVTVADLNDFALPLFGVDLEKETGIPDNAQAFRQLILDADGIVLSLAEHNGLPTAAFKSLFDWMSRIEVKVWSGKPMLLLAASPGGRGGASVLNIVKNWLPYYGGNLIADFSLPKFYDNFSAEGLKDKDLAKDLDQKIHLFQAALEK